MHTARDTYQTILSLAFTKVESPAGLWHQDVELYEVGWEGGGSVGDEGREWEWVGEALYGEGREWWLAFPQLVREWLLTFTQPERVVTYFHSTRESGC